MFFFFCSSQFTFTDEDVQQILLRKEEASAASSQTRGGLIKHAMALKHQVNSVVATLSSTATASSQRKELRENLNVLLQKKAAAEAQLAKFKFDSLATTPQGPKRSAALGGPDGRKGGLLLAAPKRTEEPLAAAASGTACEIADHHGVYRHQGDGGRI